MEKAGIDFGYSLGWPGTQIVTPSYPASVGNIKAGGDLRHSLYWAGEQAPWIQAGLRV